MAGDRRGTTEGLGASLHCLSASEETGTRDHGLMHNKYTMYMIIMQLNNGHIGMVKLSSFKGKKSYYSRTPIIWTLLCQMKVS